MEVYILYQDVYESSRFHSVWDSKDKAVDYVKNYTYRYGEETNPFYISKASMNNRDIVEEIYELVDK